MQALDWPSIFEKVIARGHDALDWRLPEAWVHAELFAELRRRAEVTGWKPFDDEIPYRTHAPVTLPSEARKKKDGSRPGGGPPPAVKYADMCLRTEGFSSWVWFEFKVRAIGTGTSKKARVDCFDAFRKDSAGLCAFDAEATAAHWCTDDPDYKAEWIEKLLKPKAEQVRQGSHSFVSAYLQLGDAHPPEWSDEKLYEGIGSWLDWRSRSNSYQPTALPRMNISRHPGSPSRRPYALILAEW